MPSSSMTGHSWCIFFFFNDTATTEIYTLSLHDALPISFWIQPACLVSFRAASPSIRRLASSSAPDFAKSGADERSEEHTSELQSRLHIVCRLLLEKKKRARLIDAYV